MTALSDLPLASPATDDSMVARQRPSNWTAWLVLFPAAVCLYFIVRSIVLLLTTPWPLSPWESIIVMDAWRTTQGINVYQLPDDGPATHMYGPLVTYVNALIFLATGPNLYSPRVVALTSTVLLTIGFVVTFARRSGALMMALAGVIVLMQFYRTRASFTESRPDAVAALLMFLSLCMLYQGHRTGHRLWTIAGSLAVVAGFGFKQPAAAVAIVPLIAVLLERPRPFGRRLLESLTAPGLVLLTLLALKFLWPEAYFYMIEVPRKFELRPDRWNVHCLNIVSFNALFVAACVVLLLERHSLGRHERDTIRWILVTCVVTACSSTLAVAKRGGGMNSYLPVFLAMSALVVVMLPQMLHRLAASGPSARRVAGATLIGLLMFVDLLAVPHTLAFANRGPSHGDANYAKVIGRVAALPGVAISPDDPTIAFFAKGYAGRSLHAEFDSTGNRHITDGLTRELKQAKWLIRRQATWELPPPRWDPQSLGWRLVNDPFMNRVRRYSLWVRDEKK